MSRLLYLTLMAMLIGGCAVSDMSDEQANLGEAGQAGANINSALGNIELHTAQLAQELFSNLRADREYRYAVITFVPVTNLKFDAKHQGPLMLLGHQLAEGMITEANRRGLITQDYKTTNDIVISKQSETVFSRDVNHLSAMPDVDFYIAGTITEQQEGAIVNARIVHVKSKDVVASATKFFPADVFWQREKVSTRGGMIYRTGS